MINTFLCKFVPLNYNIYGDWKQEERKEEEEREKSIKEGEEMDWFFEAIRDSAAADFVKGIAELAAGNWDYAAASEEADKLVSSVFGNWQEQINTFANNSTSKYGRARLAKGEETIMK